MADALEDLVGQELGALQQRDARPITGQVEDAVVERQPGQLSIDVASGGQALTRADGAFGHGVVLDRLKRTATLARA